MNSIIYIITTEDRKTESNYINDNQKMTYFVIIYIIIVSRTVIEDPKTGISPQYYLSFI